MIAVEHQHAHVAGVGEIAARNTDDTVLVGTQVGSDERRLGEEVEVGVAVFLSGIRQRLQRRCSWGAAWFCPATGIDTTTASVLDSGFGGAHGPGIQQQARACQQIPRQNLRLAAIKDVAVLVTDVASGKIAAGGRRTVAQTWRAPPR